MPPNRETYQCVVIQEMLCYGSIEFDFQSLLKYLIVFDWQVLPGNLTTSTYWKVFSSKHKCFWIAKHYNWSSQCRVCFAVGNVLIFKFIPISLVLKYTKKKLLHGLGYSQHMYYSPI